VAYWIDAHHRAIGHMKLDLSEAPLSSSCPHRRRHPTLACHRREFLTYVDNAPSIMKLDCPEAPPIKLAYGGTQFQAKLRWMVTGLWTTVGAFPSPARNVAKVVLVRGEPVVLASRVQIRPTSQSMTTRLLGELWQGHWLNGSIMMVAK